MNTKSKTVSCAIKVAYGDPGPAGLPVSVGVPFPVGARNAPATLTVQSPSGEQRPAAGRVLACHPDGSIRWCLVSFGAREAGLHEVLWTSPAPAPDPSVVLRQNAGDWTIDSGRLRLANPAGGSRRASRFVTGE